MNCSTTAACYDGRAVGRSIIRITINRTFRVLAVTLQLVIVSGEVVSAARSVPLTEGRVVIIGRSLASDLCVPEANVARRQCDIDVREGTVRLLEYGSTRGERFGNSVFVNGQSVNSIESCRARTPNDADLTWHSLQCGDEIRVGTAVFRVEATREEQLNATGQDENVP